MAEITAALVRELRQATGVGMMDCKKALGETGGEIAAATDWLRKKGLSRAAKKAGRVASEGVVAMVVEGGRGAIVELNSETDFVSRNPEFQDFSRSLARQALAAGGDVGTILAASAQSGASVADALTALIAKIGENMNVRRAAVLEVSPGVIASYVHNAVAPDLGRIGVLVALESQGDAQKLTDLGRKIAMHVAATAPLALAVDDLDPDTVSRERQVYVEQARASGKPDAIIEKMVAGRMRKFHGEVVLLQQAFVMNPDQSVAKLVEDAAADVGAPVRLAGFVRMGLGEGIEKKAEDFAAEVAAAGAANA